MVKWRRQVQRQWISAVATVSVVSTDHLSQYTANDYLSSQSRTMTLETRRKAHRQNTLTVQRLVSSSSSLLLLCYLLVSCITPRPTQVQWLSVLCSDFRSASFVSLFDHLLIIVVVVGSTVPVVVVVVVVATVSTATVALAEVLANVSANKIYVEIYHMPYNAHISF